MFGGNVGDMFVISLVLMFGNALCNAVCDDCCNVVSVLIVVLNLVNDFW